MERHHRRLFFQVLVILLLTSTVLVSCGGDNYFTQMAGKSSDEALYADALKLVDQREYDEALAKIASMSASGQSDQEVVRTRAGIYAGKCGLDFLDFVSKLDQGSSPFSLFMGGFRGVAVNVAHCQTAQNLIETNFGATGVQREALLGARIGGNLFMAVLGMTKIGTQLRAVADVDGAGGTGNGTVDAGFDACDAGSISDTDLVNVGTGFALLLDNLAAIASSLSGSNASLLDGINATCGDPLMPTNPCTATSTSDPVWSDGNTRTIIRSLIKSQSFGIEACASGPAPIPYPFNCCF
ncbi:MAG TPA: hypothetical protein PL182_05255 [Pseudobdellovibrionaceae bacterium]|nr:hypothetical protein [Pseudobdellovibrionaceae bacterium]